MRPLFRWARRVGSARNLRGTLGLVLISAAFLVDARADASCATDPPPEGLVERCRSKDLWIGSGTSEGQRHALLQVTLVEWMSTCVTSERAPGLVAGAEESVDRVFDLIKDLSGDRSVTILPDYTPLEYTEDGHTCYGVQSVSFRVAGAQGSVDADADFETSDEPSSDMIKEAASAARQALQDPSVQGSAELSRFQSVLIQLEEYGSDFDDTWYDVGPYPSGDPMDVAACFTGVNECLPADDALQACERHLARELVQHHQVDQVSPQRFAVILEEKANHIQRGVDYLHHIQSADSPGALPCPSIEEVFMPRVAELARHHSVYGAGQY
jgi:hypothetical protein